MKISVVIPTHERRESLFRLLDSLTHQTLGRGDVEVLVVFNLPDQSLKQELREKYNHRINCTVLVTGKLGVNHARHLGGNHALGNVVVFLDDDCRLQDSRYLERVHDLHLQYPEAAAIGGPYCLPAGTNVVERVYHQISLSWLENSVFDSPWTRNLIGGNVSYKRAVFDRGFNFNARIRFGGAETDFHMRLQKHRLRLLYASDLSVEHWQAMTPLQFFKKGFWQGYGFENRVLKGIQIPQATRANPLLTPSWSPEELRFVRLYDYAFQKGRLWARSRRTSDSSRKGLWQFASASLTEDFRQLSDRWTRASFLPRPEAK